MTTTKAPYDNFFSAQDYPYAEYGIIGNFEGDEELGNEIEWCKQTFLLQSPLSSTMTTVDKSTLERLIKLFRKLPYKGRKAIIDSIVGKSPYRNTIFCDLYEYCFQNDDIDNDDGDDDDDDIPDRSRNIFDEDIIRLANNYPTTSTPSEEKEEEIMITAEPLLLNFNRHDIFSLAIMLIPYCNENTTDSNNDVLQICKTYLQSTSNSTTSRYRIDMIISLATKFGNDQCLSDDELYDIWYNDTSNLIKNKIIHECQKQSSSCPSTSTSSTSNNNTRKGFLQKVYETSPNNTDLLYWLDGSYVASKLQQEQEQQGEEKKNSSNMLCCPFQLKRWDVHGEVYIEYIQRKLEPYKDDKLILGEIWSNITSKIEYKSMKSDHAKILFELNMSLEPYTLTPTRFPYSIRNDIISFIKDASKKGEEDISVYDGVIRLFPSTGLIGKINTTADVNIANNDDVFLLSIVLNAYKDRDWIAFNQFKGHVNDHFQLPYEEVYSQINSEEYWDLTSSYNQGTNNNFSFLKFFFFDFWEKHLVQSKEDCCKLLQCWEDLHMRYKPSNLSSKQISIIEMKNYSNKNNNNNGATVCSPSWQKWYETYSTRLLSKVGKQAVVRIRKEINYPFPISTELKQQSEIVTMIIRHVVAGIEAADGNLPTEKLLEPLFKLLKDLESLGLWKSNVSQVQELFRQAEETIATVIVPRLAKMIYLNPLDKKTFVTQTQLSYFCSNSTDLTKWAVKSEKVGRLLSKMMLDIYDKASTEAKVRNVEKRQFTVNDDGDSPKRKFLPVDNSMVSSVVSQLMSSIELLFREQQKSDKHDAPFVKDLWRSISASKKDTTSYISTCFDYLKGDMLEEERSMMIEKSAKHIQDTMKKVPYGWKDALGPFATQLAKGGLLEAALDKAEIKQKSREILERDHGDFTNEKVQMALKEVTFAADGETRADGLVKWLNKAFETKSLNHVTHALAFAASRLKNESGVHRRTVFTSLQSTVIPSILMLSLKSKDEKSKCHAKLANLLVAILENDLKRIDSVARLACFNRISSLIIAEVIRYNPSQLLLERRQTWISCATKMDWMLTGASEGEEKLRCYTIRTLGVSVPSSKWISPESFEKAYPISEKGNTEKLGTMVRWGEHGHFNFQNVRKVDENTFGPRHCVSIFDKALKEVWDDEFPCDPLYVSKTFPEDEDVAIALRNRIERMISLCGRAWLEVDQLVETFDNIFSNLDEATEHHVKEASTFLDNIVNGRYASTHEPRIAKAVDSIFRWSVKHSDKALARRWMGTWQSMYLDYCGTKWDSLDDDERFKSLQISMYEKFGPKYEPGSCRQVFSTNDKVLRQCIVARELLNMSDSALVVDEVQKLLCNHREDVLLKCCDKVKSVEGIFNFVTESIDLFSFENEYDSVDSWLYEILDETVLLRCSPRLSRRYSSYALQEAGNVQLDIRSRVKAMCKFVNAPTTQHVDVLKALQSELEDSVKNVLIHHVFSLDSPWHILAYLLSPTAIETNDEQVTNSLFWYLTRYVHMSKVVRVAGVLLKASRRDKLSMQLHKSILRTLLNADTDEATSLLQTEWKCELPVEVRTLLVERCMERVIAGRVDGWEASILTSVATDPTFGLETKILLFAAAQGHSLTMAIPKAEECETNDLLDQFRRMMPPKKIVPHGPVANFFGTIFEKLEGTSTDSTALRSLARYKKLSMKPIFNENEEIELFDKEGQAVLQEISTFLTTVPSVEKEHSTHENQFLMENLSSLFAYGIIRPLKNMLRKSKTNHNNNNVVLVQQQQQQQQKKIVTTDEETTKEMLKQTVAVQMFHSCIRKLLNEVLDLSVRQVTRRKQLLQIMKMLLESIPSSSPSSLSYRGLPSYQESILKQVLFEDPFKEQLDILRNDIVRLNGIISE